MIVSKFRPLAILALLSTSTVRGDNDATNHDSKLPTNTSATAFQGPHEEFEPTDPPVKKKYLSVLTEPITLRTDGKAYGVALPRPADVTVQRLTTRPGADRAIPNLGAPELLYSNTLGAALIAPGQSVLIADDLRINFMGTCTLESYELLVSGGGDGTGPGFAVQTSLFDHCPGAGGVVIEGTQTETLLPDDGVFLVSIDLAGQGVQIPESFWISAAFSTATGGWIAGAPAEVGFSADFYHFPLFPCSAEFAGTLHASFYARIFASDCVESGNAYTQVNVDGNGSNIFGDAANEPSLAVDPTNTDRIAIGWRQFDTILNSFREAGWAFSSDGGESWTFAGEIESGVFRSDPVLEFDADGNFYYNSLAVPTANEFVTTVFRSFDGGQTWDTGEFAFGGDKQWMTIDRTEGPGRGHIYQAWSLFAGCCGSSTFNMSTDGGATFTDPIFIPLAPRWGTLSVGPDGALYVAGAGSSGGIAVSKSSNVQNAGATPLFEQAVTIDFGGVPGIGGGPNPAGLLGQVWVATDHSGTSTHGNVYVLVTLNNSGNSDPGDVLFSRSEDGGATWSTPMRINDDPLGNDAWQWFGTMSVAPNGRIDAVWNDTRNTGDPALSEVFYASSTDGGVTWSTNRSLTGVFDSHAGFPQQNKLGDYYDLVSFDGFAYLAFAATFNGEQDVYFMRIDVDCNGNGVADSEDVAPGGGSSDCNGNVVPDECEPDCNDTGVPDDCDIALGTSADCNDNAVPDECDIASGNSLDTDGNGVPDECEIEVAAAPLAAILANSDPCTADEDCLNQASCIGGDCYAPRNRYLAIRANPANIGVTTARRIRLLLEPGPVVLGWVGESDADGISRIVAEPYFADWSAAPTELILLSDCGITPGNVYDVQALTAGLDPANESHYSLPLSLPTTQKWGDIAGVLVDMAWSPPNGVGNFDDVLAAVQVFQGAPTQPPWDWADIDDEIPNGIANLADIQRIVHGGFQGNPYPFADPLRCSARVLGDMIPRVKTSFHR